MPLPNVLVIGAQKCGTSALYWLLHDRPDCVVGTVKESHFFVKESPWPFGNWDKGLDWYRSLYTHDAAVVADMSPSYTGWPLFPGVPERAAATVPDATIVYLVRDPVDRAVAHWRHWISKGYDKRSFEKAMLDPDPMNQYVIGSSYGTQLDRWRASYPAERILVMHQDEVRTGAKRFFDHFGLPAPSEAPRRVNTSDGLSRPRPLVPSRLLPLLPKRLRSVAVDRPEVSDRVRKSLLGRLHDDIESFEASTGVQVLRRSS